MPWDHQTTIYQIYPRSYYDSNGDGIGDIRGIITKLDYIKSIGFETIWCSPFFKSPQHDFGYDITDYRGIDSCYGSMQDALQLIEGVHRRGMKIVFDMVMNHTSDQHPWFVEDSKQRSGSPGPDRYIWRTKPNNWRSMTGGSGWHYSKERGQYYWASFLPFQPDLNYRNPEVKRAMLDNVRFWLDKGVDGFRLDIFNVIYKDAEFRNNPFSFSAFPDESNPSGLFMEARYTINQPESMEFARELRSVCDQYGEKMLLGEVSGERETIRKFLGLEKNDGLGLVFDFEMLRFKFKAKYFRSLIANLEKDFPPPFTPVYVFSNHDRRRSMTRLGGDLRKAKLLHLMQLTLRGVPCVYQGEEIGMSDTWIRKENALDPIAHKYSAVPRVVFDLIGETVNRDEVRTPMQWSDAKHAGFSSGEETWLPVNPNYKEINVQTETADENSLLNMIRGVLKIRNESSALKAGSLSLLSEENLPGNMLGFIRKHEGEEILVLLNFGKSEVWVDIPRAFSKLLFSISPAAPQDGKIKIAGYSGVILAH